MSAARINATIRDNGREIQKAEGWRESKVADGSLKNTPPIARRRSSFTIEYSPRPPSASSPQAVDPNLHVPNRWRQGMLNPIKAATGRDHAEQPAD